MLQKIAATFATLIRTWNMRMKYFLMNFMGLPLLQCQILREFFFPLPVPRFLSNKAN